MRLEKLTFSWLAAFTTLCIILLLWGVLHTTVVPRLHKRPIMVLCYHDISPTPKNRFARTPEQLTADFSLLKNEGIRIIPLSTMVLALQKGTKLSDNTVVLTFDDATKGQFEFARPLLKKYNFPATFFVPTKSVSSHTPVSAEYSGVMTWQELALLKKEGFSLESHSHAHHSYADLNPDQIENDLALSLKILHDNLGITSQNLCLPYGEYLPNNEQLFQKMSFRSIALTTTDHGIGLKSLIKIHRFEIKRNTTQNEILTTIKPL